MNVLQIVALVQIVWFHRVQTSIIEEDDEETELDEISSLSIPQSHKIPENISNNDEIYGENAPKRYTSSDPWPNRIVYFNFFSDFPVKEKSLIMAMMEKIENVSCVRFINSSSATTFVEIEFGVGTWKPCESKIGYSNSGVRKLFLQQDCMNENDVLHELMHVLGFSHEHTRHDRDEYVKINNANIKEKCKKKNFERRPYHFLYFNMDYDFNSVLHYPIDACAIDKTVPTIETLSGHEIKANGLSSTDIRKINLYYTCDLLPGYKEYSNLNTINKTSNKRLEFIFKPNNFTNNLNYTPLHYAARNGQTDEVLKLLDNGSDVYAQDKFGNTPISLASLYGRTSTVDALLKFDVNLVNVTNHLNYTPLHRAAWKGHTDIVRAFIGRGANAYAKVKFGDTPIHFAAFAGRTTTVQALLEFDRKLVNVLNDLKSTPLHFAAATGHTETVLALLDKGADVNAKANFNGDPGGNETHVTALHLASQEGHTETVSELLLRRADASAKLGRRPKFVGYSAIHLACLEGRTATVIAMVEFNATLVAVTNDFNYTPLHLASMKGHTETALALLDRGADINAKSWWVWETSGSAPTVTALHLAAYYGHVDTLRHLLNYHADENAKDNYGNTAIHFAIIEGRTSVVKALLQFNQNLVKSSNIFKYTPLHIAARDGHTEIVVTLLEKGANVNAKGVYADDPSGIPPLVTALHFAAYGGHLQAVKALLNFSADVNAKDRNGNTPVHLAAQEGKTSVVSALIHYNSNLVNVRNKQSQTPRQIAAINNRLETVAVLNIGG